MTYKFNTIVFTFFLHSVLISQPGTAKLTPEKKIKLLKKEIIVPVRYQNSVTVSHSLNIPEGYETKVFYAGKLSKGRFMSWGPDSVLHIANLNSGEVIALPDRDHDNVADTAIVAATNAYGHDIKFFKGDMYVAEEKKVLKFSDYDKDGVYESRSVFIDSILEGKKRPPGGHTTRTIVFDGKKNKIYLSVGSLCNACREDDRAVIYEYDLNGKNKKIFASGTRNCVGMTLHPVTGDLWATNNGSDHLGEDIPPEWIDKIRKDGFYGYPFAYGNQVYIDFSADSSYQRIPPLTQADSARVKTMIQPEALVQAHSAPMAIEFSNAAFKKDFSQGAFVAYRGSWDREKATGYKVVYLHFDKKNHVTGVSDFISGFILPGEKKGWARPVGLQTDRRGNLFMSSDDVTQFILVLSRVKS